MDDNPAHPLGTTGHGTATLLQLVIAILFFIGAGCTASEVQPDKPVPPKINLPNPPSDMTVKRTSDRFADGSYSVTGLIRRRNKLFGEFVEVKGFVHQVHRCEATEVCDTPSHAVVVDDLERPTRRLVVLGDDKSGFKTLRQGQAQLIRGLYRQTDPTGVFVRMEGIVVMSPIPKSTPPVLEDEPTE